MAFEPQASVVIYPGPEMKDPPFASMRVNECDVEQYVAKGWTTEQTAPAEEDDDPEQPEEIDAPKKKTKTKK